MRRGSKVLLAVMLTFVFTFSSAVAYADEPDIPSEKPAIQLSDMQKKELAAIHQDILDKRKELIAKYVDFGVISEEKGKMAISRMEKHFAMLEKNGFIPHCEYHHHNHHTKKVE